MTAFWWALLGTSACLWLGDRCNRRWFGFLPDDPPRPGRKQHAAPIALGGVLLVPALLGCLVAERGFWPGWPWAVAAVALAGAIGFVDDRGKEHGDGLDWRRKGLGLCVVAGATAMAMCDPLHAPERWLLYALLAFVLVNAVNFLDNTDGVATAIVAVPLASECGGWPLASAACGLAFLPWNWPRPRLFLGDAGAFALGTLLALHVQSGLHDGPTALWLAAVPLADFVQVVLVRLWLRHPPWVGDRRHLTHIAHHLGLPRVATAPLFAALAFAASRAA